METADKKYTVIISDEATQMLVSHSRFLVQVSEQAALNLITEFKEKAKSLERSPSETPCFPIPLCP